MVGSCIVLVFGCVVLMVCRLWLVGLKWLVVSGWIGLLGGGFGNGVGGCWCGWFGVVGEVSIGGGGCRCCGCCDGVVGDFCWWCGGIVVVYVIVGDLEFEWVFDVVLIVYV